MATGWPWPQRPFLMQLKERDRSEVVGHRRRSNSEPHRRQLLAIQKVYFETHSNSELYRRQLLGQPALGGKGQRSPLSLPPLPVAWACLEDSGVCPRSPWLAVRSGRRQGNPSRGFGTRMGLRGKQMGGQQGNFGPQEKESTDNGWK